ncbi:uncharacterized protein RJT21DRAFT_43618 [Scheffersomyces amazonensis]|uniref:uncharacterized protein n=1 Tax=Scheffersomyces amazonensis TaxID=1078765 RepID=UPI00315D87E4
MSHSGSREEQIDSSRVEYVKSDVEQLNNEELEPVPPISVSEQVNTSNNNNNVNLNDHSVSDSDDDYIQSEDDEEDSANAPHLAFTRSLSEHATYLTNSLAHALDSVQLDKSLALQAQLSGKLNNQNQIIMEKHAQLAAKFKTIQNLYEYNFSIDSKSKISRVKQMRNDLTDIERRLVRLKNGPDQSSIFPFIKPKSTQEGVIKKYPIEYNQAKSKIIERQIDE